MKIPYCMYDRDGVLVDSELKPKHALHFHFSDLFIWIIWFYNKACSYTTPNQGNSVSVRAAGGWRAESDVEPVPRACVRSGAAARRGTHALPLQGEVQSGGGHA